MGVPAKLDNPKLASNIVQDIQTKLESLSWLEYVYPLANMGYDEDGLTYPSVYLGEDGYSIDILPDSNIDAYCFFEDNGFFVLNDYAGVDYYLSLTVWGRLDKINPSKEYDFTQELILDVLKKLNEYGCEDIKVFTMPVVIFEVYTRFIAEQNQALARPNTGFKISFKYHNTGDCI